MNNINLLTFCKEEQGAFLKVLPIKYISAFLNAYQNREINRIGFKNCIESLLQEIIGVGIINDNVIVMWKCT